MDIVITIPDEVFEAYKHWEENGVATVEQTLIAHGTVLPKGHGRLIDADKMLYFRCPNNVLGCPTSYDFTCQHCDYGVASKFRIDGMPTIVEADKENSNETVN